MNPWVRALPDVRSTSRIEPHPMLSPDVIRPSRVWMQRSLIFSSCYLALVLVGGYFIHWVLLLLPFAGYRAAYTLSALVSDSLAIELHTDYLVFKSPFRKPAELQKQSVLRFLAVYRGTTEIVVARSEQVDPQSQRGRRLVHKSDIAMPQALMRSPDLVRRLESWRTAATYARGI